MGLLELTTLNDSRMNDTAVLRQFLMRYFMKKFENDLNNKHLSSMAMKGATTGIVIGARFGPQGVIIGACIGGVIGLIIDHQANNL